MTDFFRYKKLFRVYMRSTLWIGVSGILLVSLFGSQIYKISGMKPAVIPRNNALMDPIFDSLDKKGHPYKIRAYRANQTGEDTFSFLAPAASLRELDGRHYVLTGKTGTYERAKKLFSAKGSVLLRSDSRYRVLTDSATMNLKTKDVMGNESVRGEGPMGAFRAEGFEVKNNGHNLILKGRSHVTIVPSQASAFKK